mmetsp:Transcript_37219/g.118456  ORF Transcript_37219/g.118456 Transcript_37219/m.118456 type:complete len:248 (+) Transcript_37219:38-781(+)
MCMQPNPPGSIFDVGRSAGPIILWLEGGMQSHGQPLLMQGKGAGFRCILADPLARGAGHAVLLDPLPEDLLGLLVDAAVEAVAPAAEVLAGVVLALGCPAPARPRVEEGHVRAVPPVHRVEEADGEVPLLREAHEGQAPQPDLSLADQPLRRLAFLAAVATLPGAARDHLHEAALHHLGVLAEAGVLPRLGLCPLPAGPVVEVVVVAGDEPLLWLPKEGHAVALVVLLEGAANGYVSRVLQDTVRAG